MRESHYAALREIPTTQTLCHEDIVKFIILVMLLVSSAVYAVEIPENGKLNYLGNGWECKKGFYKSGGQCHTVKIPQNANLNYLGNGWECIKGFYKSGGQCHTVKIPQNAKLNYLGNGWECRQGYKKSSSSCIAMTAAEIQRQKERAAAIALELQKRRAQGVSGDDCETEYKTNAEVCVEITGGDIDCNENYSGNYYNDCDVSLSYDVNTDYGGGAYLDVEVECTVEVEYKGRNTYSTQSDSSRDDESHSLYAHGSDSETLNFNFSFSSYQEIISAKISGAECEIDSVDMY